jgi:hypothetical protein
MVSHAAGHWAVMKHAFEAVPAALPLASLTVS